jgi:periplasmic protein TonB
MSAVLSLPRLPAGRATPAQDRLLAIAFAVSLGLHAVVLSVRFAFPEKFTERIPPQLEVVLVNSKTANEPRDPNVLAQANLDGGGNTDADRHAKTPLPALRDSVAENPAIQARHEQVKELEREQQQLLTQLKDAPAKVELPPVPAAPEAPVQPTPVPAPVIDGRELAAQAIALARLEAQIARRLDQYEKRPRKAFVGARAAEARFALYVDEFRDKVERFGSNNYPSDARGRIYGSLRLTVSIRADGTLDSVEIDRPSGHRILDDAARRIVKLASPFASFPPDMKRDTDVIVITRTWFFEPGDTLRSE